MDDLTVPCRKCGGLIHDGDDCIIVGPIHDLDANTTRNEFEHLEGRCEK